MRSHRQSLRFASETFARTLALLASALLLVACGAKTGLDTPDVEAGPDVGVDAADIVDIPLTPRTVRCDPVRVRTRVGFVASIRPDTDVAATMGVTWTVDSSPPGSNPSVLSDGSLLAAITPLVTGEYDLTAQIPTPFADGGHLSCSVVVIAEPPDPECPGYAITEPRPVEVPGGDVQVAYDIIYDDPRTVSNSSAGAILADDVTARVSTLVIERPTTEDLGDLMGALAAEGDRAEASITSALGATEVLLGRSAITHDQHPLRRSTLRVDTGTTTPSDLRDRALRALTSLSPPPPAMGPTQAPASQFYVEIVTILRQDTAHVVTLVAVSPVAAFDDITSQTAIRVNDFANGTSVARAGATLAVRCHAVVATRSVEADFLWLVDTSGSMYDDQSRVGSTAERFFSDLRLAGVDFRVGVFQAGHTAPRLTGPPAFRWISGNDPMGAREMAFEVTELEYMNNAADTEKPFRVSGADEEPLAAAVEVIKEFERRRLIGETNPNFVLRPGAAVVTFLVTDEDGNNDYSRYFATNTPTPPAPPWGSTPATLVSNISQFFTGRGIVPFGLVPVFPGAPCPSISNLVECVITRASGAFIPINVADSVAQAQVEAAMARIVDTVAGAASEFVLPVDPISSSLRARVDGRLVPRSRSDGFDYEERARALVFRGATYRPTMGQEVRTAYFVWCDGSTPGGC